MAFIKDTLLEEYERLNRIKKSYEDKILELPKGSIVKKCINGHEYNYLVYRDGTTSPKTKYLNSFEDLDLLKKQIEQRRSLEKAIREINKDFKIIRRAIKI